MNWRGLLRGEMGFDSSLPFIQAFRVGSWLSLVLNVLSTGVFLTLLLGTWLLGWQVQQAGIQRDSGILELLAGLSAAILVIDIILLVRLHLGRGGLWTLLLGWIMVLLQITVFPLGTLVSLAMVPALVHPVTRRALGRRRA